MITHELGVYLVNLSPQRNIRYINYNFQQRLNSSASSNYNALYIFQTLPHLFRKIFRDGFIWTGKTQLTRNI